jgi:ABC-2 type transport system ATP-binding protein
VTDAIRIRGLGWKAGRDFAIQDLNLTVPTGAIYGFLGPNGSGKTTTIRLLLGMLEPDAGSIEVLGHQVPREAHRALARIGYVPERLHLYQSLTVAENIRFRRAFHPQFDATEAERLRAHFGLRPDQPVSRLSKGESGKLMMLLALAQKPELLVLDEPTDGLDPVLRRELLASLVEYVGTHHATVFISSHLVHEQERICDWVGVMDGGRLIAELPMQEFRSGIKKVRVYSGAAGDAGMSAAPGAPGGAPPIAPANAPFALLSRERVSERVEEWVVRGWQPPMAQWFASADAEVRDVIDLDLEESFVELLRGARGPGAGHAMTKEVR